MLTAESPTSQLGSTTVGICTKGGVVLAVEKRTQSPLLESDSVEKILEIDSHIGCALSGLTADARTMVEHGRVTSQVSKTAQGLSGRYTMHSLVKLDSTRNPDGLG